MKQTLTKKFLPYVSLDEALAYDPKMPETQTASPIVNAVLDALEILPRKDIKSVANYLQVERRHLNGAIIIAAGVSVMELRDQWLLQKYEKIKAEHNEWPAEKVARHLGFGSDASVWRFLKRMKADAGVKRREQSLFVSGMDWSKWDENTGKWN